jgi:class 3 adenylate cyclase
MSEKMNIPKHIILPQEIARWENSAKSDQAQDLLKLFRYVHEISDFQGNIAELFRKMLHSLVQLLEVHNAAVVVRNLEGEQVVMARYNMKNKQIDDEVFKQIGLQAMTANEKIVVSGRHENVRNAFAVPITKSGNMLGALVLLNKASGNFTEFDDIVVNLVELNVDHVLYNWIKGEELAQVTREVELIKELDTILEDTSERRETLDKMIKEIAKSLEAEIGYIFLYNSNGKAGKYSLGGYYFNSESAISNDDMQLLNKTLKQAKNEGQAISMHKIVNSEMTSLLVVPMYISTRFMGSTVVINKKDYAPFSNSDKKLVNSVNRLVNNFIFQSAKFEELTKLVGSEAKKDIDQALNGRGFVRSEGESKNITMLFADIRNYTKLTKDMSPKETVSMLNDFFSVITPIISEHGGIVDKFVGDEAVVLFGLVDHDEDHAVAAVKTALKINEELVDMNRGWKSVGKNRPDIHVGIGIHTGDVVVGQMGSNDRKDFTAIGANMNFAARLMSVAGAGQIIISKDSYVRLSGKFAATRVNTVHIKGIGEYQPYSIQGKAELDFTDQLLG